MQFFRTINEPFNIVHKLGMDWHNMATVVFRSMLLTYHRIPSCVGIPNQGRGRAFVPAAVTGSVMLITLS